jgi:hypothetical protein
MFNFKLTYKHLLFTSVLTYFSITLPACGPGINGISFNLNGNKVQTINPKKLAFVCNMQENEKQLYIYMDSIKHYQSLLQDSVDNIFVTNSPSMDRVTQSTNKINEQISKFDKLKNNILNQDCIDLSLAYNVSDNKCYIWMRMPDNDTKFKNNIKSLQIIFNDNKQVKIPYHSYNVSFKNNYLLSFVSELKSDLMNMLVKDKIKNIYLEMNYNVENNIKMNLYNSTYEE